MILSVVVIAKNEEIVIKKCLKSIVIACKKHLGEGEYEIILVDSNSSDETISKASNVLNTLEVKRWKILKYTSNYYTAALAREIGREHVTGEYILFMDGDMLIYSNFIKQINNIRENKIDAVVGKRLDLVNINDKRKIRVWRRKVTLDNKTLYPGGCILVKSSCLQNIHYNIEQKSKEEESLAKKMYAKGYHIQYWKNENMYLHLHYKLSQRGLKTRLEMTKTAARCITNSIKRHYKEFGILSTIQLYYYEIINYTLVPIGILISFLSSFINNKIYLSASSFILLAGYVLYNRRSSLISIYQIIYLGDKKLKIEFSFEVIEEKNS